MALTELWIVGRRCKAHGEQTKPIIHPGVREPQMCHVRKNISRADPAP